MHVYIYIYIYIYINQKKVYINPRRMKPNSLTMTGKMFLGKQ